MHKISENKLYITSGMCYIIVETRNTDTQTDKQMTNIKKYKVTYQNEVGLHIEELNIVLFAPNADQAKRTAWIRLNREGKTPLRISDNWATVKEV